MGAYVKDPSDEIERGFNWGPFLNGVNTIVGSTWATTDGLELLDNNIFTDTTTKVFIKQGINGNSYEVTNEVTLNNGEIMQRSFTVIVRDL